MIHHLLPPSQVHYGDLFLDPRLIAQSLKLTFNLLFDRCRKLYVDYWQQAKLAELIETVHSDALNLKINSANLSLLLKADEKELVNLRDVLRNTKKTPIIEYRGEISGDQCRQLFGLLPWFNLTALGTEDDRAKALIDLFKLEQQFVNLPPEQKLHHLEMLMHNKDVLRDYGDVKDYLPNLTKVLHSIFKGQASADCIPEGQASTNNRLERTENRRGILALPSSAQRA